MADKKITQLDTIITPEDADLFYIVINVATTPLSKAITWGSLKTALQSLFTRTNKDHTINDNSIVVFDGTSGNKVKATKAKIEEDGSILLPNGQSIKFKNYSGTGDLNALKGTTSDELELGTTLNSGTIEVEEDAGAVTIIDMGVTSASADGTEMSYVVKIDGNNILKIYAESNGAGGADTFKVQLLNKAVLTMEDSAGTTHTYTSDTDGSLIIS